MPYPADLAGKAIQIDFNRGAGLHPAQTNQGVVPGMSLAMSVPVFNYRPGRAGTGGAPPVPPLYTNTNLPWNIQFLWWVPGENATARLSSPVLTGPMSGCYLFRYVLGGPRVVHIGTDTVPQNTQQAKNNWKIYVNSTLLSAGAMTVFGASPKDNAENDVITLHQQGIQFTKIFGLFLPDNTAYTLCLQQLPNNMYAVHAIRPMPLAPWATVKTRPIWTS